MNTEQLFRSIVRAQVDLPIDVRTNIENAFGIEEHRFDRTYIDFLDQQITLAPRGLEWSARLRKRKEALEQFCDKLLIRGRIKLKEKDYTIEVDPSNDLVIHIEEYEE